MDNTNQIQKSNSTTIALSETETAIAKQVFRINSLLPSQWPLTNGQIVDWTKEILKTCPDATHDKIDAIIEAYKKDVYQWDKSKGVQNIIRHLMPYKQSFNLSDYY